MKKMLFAGALSVLAMYTFSQQTVYDAHAEQRAVKPFTAIEASAGIEVLITPGDKEALAVSSSDPELAKYIITEVEGETLKIRIDPIWKWGNKTRNWRVKAYVSYRQLHKVKASSGAIVKGEIRAGALALTSNSGAVMNLKGVAEKLEVDASSGAVCKGYDLKTDFLVADVSSGANVQVTVNKEVDAEASSGAMVTFKGQALIRNINVSSGGNVKKVQ
ncbi:MAG: DUF2807 domain-containing protein [Chitinophagaceae bacterium]|jgi:hypothetical protein|nr:DUF2807 domain-containing protein [Chitinophagaceae bacterium]